MSRAKRRTDLDMLIGQRIRAIRLQRRLSQTQLADAVGVTFQQIQKYERGTNAVAPTRLTAVAAKLDVPLTALIGPDRNTDSDRLASLIKAGSTMRIVEAVSKMPSPLRIKIAELVERIAKHY